MRTIAATEVSSRLTPVLEAAQLEPIVIRAGDHDVAVLVSMTEYEKLRAFDHLARLGEHERWEFEAAAVDRISDERFAVLLADDED
jgi:PHD/YefM family antitoxin component YafN of YafNO toxin-antitoxin module